MKQRQLDFKTLYLPSFSAFQVSRKHFKEA
jgi:hypothetical protein